MLTRRAARLRHAILRGVLALLVLPLSTLPTSLAAQSPCRQALALGLDVSGSVDFVEYALQRRGLARALRHPEVADALLTMPAAPVWLYVYEWSGQGNIRPLLDWRPVTDAAALARIADQIEPPARAAMAPSTALGAAMQHGITSLQPMGHCWRRTLDISGDGKSNTGPRPGPQRALAVASGVTINALVIGTDTADAQGRRVTELAELVAYFRAYVLSGADAFVVTATGFSDYEAAMVRKLKRELSGLQLSRADAPRRPPGQ